MLMNYKKIGDTLNTAEYNAYTSLIRHNKTLLDQITIKNGTINTPYAEYQFNINSTTILDNGILITPETQENIGTITLTNPVFTKATHTITLTIISMEEINIINPNDTEVETSTITLPLIENTPVPIPFQTLNKYCIIQFPAQIKIRQDKPIIKGGQTTLDLLTLTTTAYNLDIGDTATLTVTAYDTDGELMSDVPVKFYDGETLLDTVSTGDDGTATYTYEALTAGTHTLKAKSSTIESNNINITINTPPTTLTTITLQSNKQTIYTNETATLTISTFDQNDDPLSNVSVGVYENSNLLDTVVTGVDGTQTYSYSPSGAGVMTLKAISDNVESSGVSITVLNIPTLTTLTLVSDKATMNLGETATLTITSLDQYGNNIDVTGIQLYSNGTAYGSTFNTVNGTATQTISPATAGTFTLKVGKGVVESTTVQLVVNSVTPPTVDSITLTGSANIIQSGGTSVLTATALDSNNDGVSGVSLTVYQDGTSKNTITTGSDGTATYTYTGSGVGDTQFCVTDGTIQSEIYELEDCTYYHESAFTSTQNNFNVALPSDFEISFKVRRTSNSGNSSYIEVGGDIGNTALFGQVGGRGNSALWLYDSEGSSQYTETGIGTTPLNQDSFFTWVKNGSSHTVSMNDTVGTTTNSLTHSKVRKISITNNQVKELKIKPL